MWKFKWISQIDDVVKEPSAIVLTGEAFHNTY